MPDRITLEDGERVRKAMRGMVQGDIDTYYPEDLITYATGHRKGVDAEGTGPGMYYALWLALLLQACGIKCFSGLCVAGGVNWKVFLDKLGGRFARCKRLFVVQTDALYNSRPCLQEIYTAVSRKLLILPVLFEKTPLMFRPKDQWPQLTVDDSEGKGWLLAVQRIFGALNSLPSPPATAVEQPAALLETLGHIAAEGNTAAQARRDDGNGNSIDTPAPVGGATEAVKQTGGERGPSFGGKGPLKGTLLHPVMRQTGPRWARRFCVLTDEALLCYKAEDRQDMVTQFIFGTRAVDACRGLTLPALAAAAGKGKKGKKGKGKKRKGLQRIPHAMTLSAGGEHVLLAARDEAEASLWCGRLQQCAAAALERVVDGRVPCAVDWFRLEAPTAADKSSAAAATSAGVRAGAGTIFSATAGIGGGGSRHSGCCTSASRAAAR